eukprot:COSAG06_NODE_1954_length_7985_cov_27.960817_1_plen_162_part_00
MLFQDFIWWPLHHQWMYFFMQTNTLMVIPWMLGLLIIHWIFFVLVYYLVACKSRCGCGSDPVPLMHYPQMVQTPLGKPACLPACEPAGQRVWPQPASRVAAVLLREQASIRAPRELCWSTKRAKRAVGLAVAVQHRGRMTPLIGRAIDEVDPLLLLPRPHC